MGKAAIILVLAAVITVAYGALGNQETALFTAKNQANYEENILAREIAKSGFNAAMSILRQHGDSLQAGVLAVNGSLGYLEGQHHGGVYRARARYISGSAAEVTATGYFGGEFEDGEYVGGATHRIDDNFIHELARRPLHASQCGRVEMQLLNTQTAYCSAVYMQRFVAGAQSPSQPELIFPSGRNRDGAVPAVDKWVQAGTQLNFLIAVDKNCLLQTVDLLGYNYDDHVFTASAYNHVHRALEITANNTAGVSEAIWAIVDQHPADNQRWRIAWEDEHNWNITNPKQGHYNDPTRSLMGLKMYGYDNNGWPHTDARGYRTLQTHLGRPDLSDQVLEVSIDNDECPIFTSGDDGGGGDGGDGDGGEVESCPCPMTAFPSRTIWLIHRPPGNPANEQGLCVAPSAIDHHLKSHDDYVVCQG